jgi:hypothetical protein
MIDLSPGFRRAVARTAFFVAVGLVAVAIFGAVAIEPIGPIEGPARIAVDVVPRRTAGLSEPAAALVADSDPFRPDRTRPARDPESMLPDEPAPGPVDTWNVKLFGTVVLPDDRGVAMLRWSEEPARVVRIGQSIGPLTLRRVEPGSATLVADDGSETVVNVERGGTR